MSDKEISPALESIRKDIQVIGTFMRDFSMHVISDEISQFPVYVAFQDVTSLGKPFFTKESHELNWNFNASILEEFVKRGVVMQDKVEEFQKTFGDPEERACIFILTPEGANFVFVPYEVG